VTDDHDHDGRMARLGICSVCEAQKVSAGAQAAQLVEAPVVHQADLFGSLDGQVGRVLDYLKDGRWHTLRAIAGALDIPETSASARIRDLRKPEFGSHDVRLRPAAGRAFEYRLFR
jgi:hypothetical protein